MAVALVAVGLLFAALFWLHWWRVNSLVPTHSYDLQSSRMGDWTPVGGEWQMSDGVVHASGGTRGALLMTGSSAWSNVKLTADVRLDGVAADTGVVIRSDEERLGINSYNGYYIGLRTLDDVVTVGRANYGWTEAPPVPIPGGGHPSVWYRFQVIAVSCQIAASVENLATHQTVVVAFEEFACKQSGRIGLRSWNPATFRNVSVAPANWNDYVELSRKAPRIVHLQFTSKRPWWTPWHVGLLFGSILIVGLLAQLFYFRAQQWKANTIAREREQQHVRQITHSLSVRFDERTRIARELHDTLMQTIQGSKLVVDDALKKPDNTVRMHAAMEEVSTWLGQAMQEGRAALNSLRTSITETNDLSGALRHAIEDSRSEHPIKVSFSEVGDPRQVHSVVRDELYRIGFESIRNACMHSQGNSLEVKLTYGHDLSLRVTDNGIGIESSIADNGKDGHFGLQGMRERAARIGSKLIIVSSANAGTEITVVVPGSIAFESKNGSADEGDFNI